MTDKTAKTALSKATPVVRRGGRKAISRKTIPDTKRVNQAVVADLWGVTRGAVKNWHDCPRNSDGTYDLCAVIKWREGKFEQRATDAEVAATDAKDTEALERVRIATAVMKELDIAERRRELIPADDVHDGLYQFVAIILDACDVLEREFGSKARDAVELPLRELQRSLSETLAGKPEEAAE